MEVIKPTLTGWAQVKGGTEVAVVTTGMAVLTAGIMVAVGGITVAAGPQAERISKKVTSASNKKRANFINLLLPELTGMVLIRN